MVFQNSSSPLLAYRAGVKLRERCFIQYLVIFSLVCSIITTTPHPGLRLLFPEINCIVDAFSTRSFVLRSVVSSRILRTVISSSKDADDNDGVDINIVADPVASMETLDELLPRKKYITPLAKAKSNLLGAQQVIWHFSLLALAAKMPLFSTVSVAFVSSFFFHGLHECVHRTAFASNTWNNLFAHAFGFLSFRPACHYRYYHWKHHKYTGNPELDSELQPGSYLDFPVETLWGYIFYLSGIPFWIDAISSIINHALGDCPESYLSNEKSRLDVTREARIYLGLYVLIAILASTNRDKNGMATLLFRAWIVPALLGQPFLRFYLLAEHRGRKSSPLIYENTRTMHTNWFYRKLAWSMPYHMEHHAWPAVPFYRLKDVHKLWIQAVQGHENLLDNGETIKLSSNHEGYIQFHFDFLKALRKKKTE
jgi:fatty acid desaturase